MVSLKARRVAFYALIGLFLALFLAIAGPVIAYLVTGWTMDLGPHRLHDLAIAAFLGTVLVLGALQARAGERRPLTLAAALALLVLVFVVRWASADLFPPLLVFVALCAAALALHPGRASLALRNARPFAALAALGALALVAALPYVVEHAALQRIGAPDEHTAKAHWSMMATVALAPGVLALVASTRLPGWRIVAGAAAALMAFLALLAFVMPEQPSAPTGALAAGAVAWSALVAGSVLVRPRRGGGDAGAAEAT